MYIKKEFFREVPESWYGNFKIADDRRYENRNLVCVSLFQELSGDGYRVTVWGNDDLGMEKSFPYKDHDLAVNTFKSLAIIQPLTRHDLETFGFIYC